MASTVVANKKTQKRKTTPPSSGKVAAKGPGQNRQASPATTKGKTVFPRSCVPVKEDEDEEKENRNKSDGIIDTEEDLLRRDSSVNSTHSESDEIWMTVNRIQRLKLSAPEVTEVLPWVFVGGEKAAEDESQLLLKGITGVVNTVAFCVDCFFPDSFEYLPLYLHDRPDQVIFPLFPLVNRFIERHRVQGGRVFVHCNQGVSRSCSFVIAYLMWCNGWCYDRCYEWVRARRTVCSPNAGFYVTLQLWELELRRGLAGRSRAFALTPFDCAFPAPQVFRLAAQFFRDEVEMAREQEIDPDSPAVLYDPFLQRILPVERAAKGRGDFKGDGPFMLDPRIPYAFLLYDTHSKTYRSFLLPPRLLLTPLPTPEILTSPTSSGDVNVSPHIKLCRRDWEKKCEDWKTAWEAHLAFSVFRRREHDPNDEVLFQVSSPRVNSDEEMRVLTGETGVSTNDKGESIHYTCEASTVKDWYTQYLEGGEPQPQSQPSLSSHPERRGEGTSVSLHATPTTIILDSVSALQEVLCTTLGTSGVGKDCPSSDPADASSWWPLDWEQPPVRWERVMPISREKEKTMMMKKEDWYPFITVEEANETIRLDANLEEFDERDVGRGEDGVSEWTTLYRYERKAKMDASPEAEATRRRNREEKLRDLSFPSSRSSKPHSAKRPVSSGFALPTDVLVLTPPPSASASAPLPLPQSRHSSSTSSSHCNGVCPAGSSADHSPPPPHPIQGGGPPGSSDAKHVAKKSGARPKVGSATTTTSKSISHLPSSGSPSSRQPPPRPAMVSTTVNNTKNPTTTPLPATREAAVSSPFDGVHFPLLNIPLAAEDVAGGAASSPAHASHHHSPRERQVPASGGGSSTPSSASVQNEASLQCVGAISGKTSGTPRPGMTKVQPITCVGTPKTPTPPPSRRAPEWITGGTDDVNDGSRAVQRRGMDQEQGENASAGVTATGTNMEDRPNPPYRRPYYQKRIPEDVSMNRDETKRTEVGIPMPSDADAHFQDDEEEEFDDETPFHVMKPLSNANPPLYSSLGIHSLNLPSSSGGMTMTDHITAASSDAPVSMAGDFVPSIVMPSLLSRGEEEESPYAAYTANAALKKTRMNSTLSLELPRTVSDTLAPLPPTTADALTGHSGAVGSPGSQGGDEREEDREVNEDEQETYNDEEEEEEVYEEEEEEEEEPQEELDVTVLPFPWNCSTRRMQNILGIQDLSSNDCYAIFIPGVDPRWFLWRGKTFSSSCCCSPSSTTSVEASTAPTDAELLSAFRRFAIAAASDTHHDKVQEHHGERKGRGDAAVDNESYRLLLSSVSRSAWRAAFSSTYHAPEVVVEGDEPDDLLLAID